MGVKHAGAGRPETDQVLGEFGLGIGLVFSAKIYEILGLIGGQDVLA